MLSVSYGPFQPELEGAFLAELAALKRDDPAAPVAVVAPSRRLADRLQRLAAEDRPDAALLGVAFHTFYSLALEIVRESPFDRIVVSDPGFFDRILDPLVATGVAAARGLASSYRASLRDLVDAGVGPEARGLLEEGLVKDKDEHARLARLLDILAAYERRIARLGVAPASEITRAAIAAAGGSPVLSRYRAILYYGFYDLTGLQADFFAAVAGESPVRLFYPYVKGHPAYSFCDRFFETKLHQGGTVPAPIRPGGGERSGPALGTALDALFVPGEQGAARPGGLRFFTSSGRRDEAWRAAKEILRMVEREGYAFSEIGVVARTLEPYRAAIADAFEDSAIPYSSGAAEPLARRPAAQAVLKLLTLARRDFPALAVLDIVESPFFRGKRGRFWRVMVSRLRLHRGWLQWEGKLRPAAREDFELYPHLVAEGRRGRVVPKEDTRALWDMLAGWRAALTPSGERAWSAWAGAARSLVEETFDAEGDPAFDRALEIIDGTAVFDLLGETVGFGEFVEAAEERLLRADLPDPSPPCRGVRVQDAMDARGESYRALFLLGMREGAFPRTIREDPLLRDCARDALREAGGYWISSKRAGHDEEKLLFAMLAGSARERLIVSYPRSDEDGRLQIPSLFLHELCRAAGVSLSDPAINEHLPRQPLQKLTSPRVEGLLTPKEVSIAAALNGTRAARLRRAALGDGGEFEVLSKRAAALGRPGEPGPFDGLVGPPVEFLRSLRKKGLSPSALETLAQCPFRFFAGRVLGLAEPDEPSECGEISPAVKGEIYHAILARFHERLAGSGFWDSGGHPAWESFLARAEAEVLKSYGWRELGVYPLLWRVTVAVMRENLRRFLESDIAELRASGMRPVLFEAKLSGRLQVRLPKALAGMPFQGRADRIDAGPDSFKVVDYKSRWRKPEPLARLAAAGKALQPPLYLELAAGDERLKGLAASGVRFHVIEEDSEAGDEIRREYSAADHAGVREPLFAELASLIDAMAAGRFLVRPDDGEFGHCRWCAFDGVCRKSHPMTVWRSARG